MRISLLISLMLLSLTVVAAPFELAITIDDLPQHMDLPPGTTRLDTAKKMLSAFNKHSIKDVYGFINAGKLQNEQSRYEVLKLWVQSGQVLGNHTYDHVNFDHVSSAAFIHQIQMNEPYLSKLMLNKNYRYFRYPYLFEGDTPKKRDTVRHYLFTHHYQIAQVTVDFEDYLWNNAYVRCLKKQDYNSIEWLKKSYIEEALQSITVARKTSELLFKRNIKHILLLHIGVFDAFMLDDLLKTLEKQHVKIISLAQALEDNVYQINPNIVSKNTGSFLDQMMLARKIVKPNFVRAFIANIPEERIDHLCR